MTPAQMLDVLESALERHEHYPRARWPWQRRRELIVDFQVPKVLGIIGKSDGTDELGRPVWGYTPSQCRSIRDQILDAIRADMEAGAFSPEPVDTEFL